jgi:hypothetical protein
MSALSLFYLISSVQECNKSADANRLQPVAVVCDLPVDSKQVALVIISTVTSVGMLAFKAGKVVPIRLRWQERDTLLAERTRLLAELVSAPGAPPSSGAVPASPAPVDVQLAAAPSGVIAPLESAQLAPEAGAADDAPVPRPMAHDPEFAVARAQSPLVASSSSLSQAQVGPGAPRGECPACKESVYATDNGRVKEGIMYYHAQCVKGPCSKCNKNVYGDQARGREPFGMYYHLDCPP